MASLKQKIKEFYKTNRKRKIFLTIILIMILLLVLGYTWLACKFFGVGVEVTKKENVDEETLKSENVPIFEEEQIEAEVFNVLVVGTDTRDPNSDMGRSDTMMMISFNEAESKASLVSFMRDSLLEVPGYGKTKLGHSYAYGGVGLTINTINQTYGLDIQNYVTINFDSLVNVIDEIGGIEVPISAEEAAYYQMHGLPHIHEGVNLLTGSEALNHSRNRAIDGDFGRTRRQRSVMNGIYRKIMQNKSATDIIPLINYCLTQVETNMSIDTIYEMAEKVFGVDNLTVQQTGIPAAGTYTEGWHEGMAVLNVDVDANKVVIQEFIY